MFLQRLKKDDRPGNCGLNYDYMGSAEYESGATTQSRLMLAKLSIEGKMGGKQVVMVERNPRHVTKNKSGIAVYVFGEKSYIDSLPNPLVIPVIKERFGTDDPNIVAWMALRTSNPILIVRVGQDMIDRGNKFLQLFIDGILEEEKKAEKQELYTYANDYTLRRVDGPVYLPQNDGKPIEGNGQWVLFDETGKALDRDKYHNDIVERHMDKIGEPLPTDD